MQVFDFADVNGGVDTLRWGAALPTIRQAIGQRKIRYLRWFPNVMVESDSLPTMPLDMEGRRIKNLLDRFLPKHRLGHSCTSISYPDGLTSVFRADCGGINSRQGRNAGRWEMIGRRFQT